MKIKSQTDLITNSSSEVFTIRANGKTKEEILEILQGVHKKLTWDKNEEDLRKLPFNERSKWDKPWGSGDGGRLEVSDFTDLFTDFVKNFPKTKRSQITEEDFIKHQEYPGDLVKDLIRVYVDENFLGTCKFVMDNFEVLETGGTVVYLIWDKTGEKIIGHTMDYEVWDNLETDLERYGKLYCDNYLDDEDKE